MSFASSFAGPARNAAQLLRGNLPQMAKTLGVIIGGGFMAAVYQSAHEEIKTSIDNWRSRKAYVRGRHELILARLLGTELEPNLQQMLLHSKDSFSTCLLILGQPTTKVAQTDKDRIRQAFDGTAIVE
jgi:hypothetical protein